MICYTLTLVKSHNPLFGHRQDLHTRGGKWTNMEMMSHYRTNYVRIVALPLVIYDQWQRQGMLEEVPLPNCHKIKKYGCRCQVGG